MTFYKVLAGIASVLAIVTCVIAWHLQLDPFSTAGRIVAFAVGMALVSAGGIWAVVGLRKANPRSDKSVRR